MSSRHRVPVLSRLRASPEAALLHGECGRQEGRDNMVG